MKQKCTGKKNIKQASKQTNKQTNTENKETCRWESINDDLLFVFIQLVIHSSL